MGLTFRLGQLPDSLFTDTSNNVGIGGSPSGSYKLEVTGTSRVSGAALFSSSVTIPSSSGIVLGTTGSTDGIISSVSGTVGLRLKINTTDALVISSTLASTFSGPVGANIAPVTNYGLSTKGLYGLWIQRGSVDDSGVEIYHNGTNTIFNSSYQSTGSFGGILFYTSSLPRIAIASGGNVGIGTTAPLKILHLAKGGNVNGILFTDDAAGNYRNEINNEYSGSSAGANLMTFKVSNATTTGQNTVMTLNGAGNVLMGTTSNSYPADLLQINGSINFTSAGGSARIVESWGINLYGDTTHPVKVNSAALVLGTPTGGSSWTVGQGYKSGGGSWADSSDVRLKENIKTVENALDKITKLRGVTFDWKDEFVEDRDKSSGGFIAQEMEQIFPEFIQERGASEEEKELINSDTIKTIYLPFSFSAYLVEAIKELNQQNQDLKSRLDKAGL